MMLIAGIGLVACACLTAQDGFIDHGVGAPAAESRGVACIEIDGKATTICLMMDSSPRGWILMTDIDSGVTEQIYYSEGVPNSPPFASLMSDNGRFYTLAGRVLMELDPAGREWLFSGTPAPGESAYTGESVCDAPDGMIYAGSYPSCKLIRFDPETKEMAELGQLDPAEHYVNSLCADADGWLYAGIGTARCNLVAYNTATGTVKQIVDDAARTTGSGSVYPGVDGEVYGTAAGQWYRMSGGNAEEIEADEKAAEAPNGRIPWGLTRGTFPDGRKLKLLNLPERYMEIEADGEVSKLTFGYESEGALFTSVAAGPEGMIYASSCHPMHMVAYDTKTDKLEDYGGLAKVGGGNFCAMATLDRYVFAGAYAGGFFYRFDTTKPWNNETGDDPNPLMVGRFPKSIARPRACITHPDGKHAIMAGYMGYGLTGGGMGIYNLETDEATLIEDEDLIPNHSTICLDVLPDGNLVGGTSISTPGGGHAAATEGELYILDWETREVVFRTVPEPGASDVWSVAVGSDGMVYGLARGSKLFVFDPSTREIVHRADLGEYGGMPRHLALLKGEGCIYALMSKSIVRIAPGTYELEKVTDTPVNVDAGGAIVDGRLYFAAASHLWSYGLGE